MTERRTSKKKQKIIESQNLGYLKRCKLSLKNGKVQANSQFLFHLFL